MADPTVEADARALWAIIKLECGVTLPERAVERIKVALEDTEERGFQRGLERGRRQGRRDVEAALMQEPSE